MVNIHATLISFMEKGILLTGKSGAGKSDLALRMIIDKGAVLVSDDRVELEVIDDALYGRSPNEIRGKLEVRGVGIANFYTKEKEKISLCVELCDKNEKIERLPLPEYEEISGVLIEKIKIYPFNCSSICKIVAKISGNIN